MDPHIRQAFIPLSDSMSVFNLGDMVKIGINNVLLKVMGWWAFDIFTQMAAFLTENDTAAQTIMRNIGLFTYMVPVGLAVSINFFTGKYIGANQVILAKKVAFLCNAVALVWSVIQMIVVWVGRDYIIEFYTYDEEVTAVMHKAWYVLIIFIFFDTLQGVSAGNIGGLGLIKRVRFVTVFDYWVVGIPLAYVLMFKLHLGIEGLWYGPTAACLLNFIQYELVIQGSDWQQISDTFRANMKADKIK